MLNRGDCLIEVDAYYRWLFNRGDYLIEVTAWASLTVLTKIINYDGEVPGVLP